MISASELQCLRRFIAARRDGGLSPLDRLWAGRCAALLEERERLTERLEVLVREVDEMFAARESGPSAHDTWVI